MSYIPKLTPNVHYADERLAANVLKSPRLLGALPADELAELFALHERAVQAAAAARGLLAPALDLAAEVEAAVRNGEVDVKKLADRIGEVEAARVRRDRTVQALTALPKTVEDRIVRCVADNIDDGYDALADDLDALLDETAEVAADLGTVSSAEAAIRAGKADDWSRLIGLSARYEKIRDEHLLLLRAEDPTRFANRQLSIGYAFFAGLSSALPEFARFAHQGDTDLAGRTTPGLPLDVFAAGSVDHLLYVARNRAALRPHIGRPDDAAPSIPLDPPGVQFGPRGELHAYHGSEAAAARRHLPGTGRGVIRAAVSGDDEF